MNRLPLVAFSAFAAVWLVADLFFVGAVNCAGANPNVDASSPTPAAAASARPESNKAASGEMFGSGPVRKVGHFEVIPKPAVLADGTWALYFIDFEGPGLKPTPAQQRIYARFSSDRGKTWSQPKTMRNLPADAGAFGYHAVLVDRDGNVHVFMLCDAGTGVVRERPASSGRPPMESWSRQKLDIWHTRSSKSGWTEPKRIWTGRAGDLTSVIQTASGRIILPISYVVERSWWGKRGDEADQFTFKGKFDTTVIYSDNNGDDWKKSTSVLRTATPEVEANGAIEPVLIELTDGRILMLLRTQLGRFYESFSKDGETWSSPRPSNIKSSDSPAALSRLPDGRILLIWNNCQRHPYAAGSRHVLHASLSADDGKTWTGCREIFRDPHRNSPPPPSGDHGVSYPFVAVTHEGTALISLWVQTGEGRSLWELDPSWLAASSARSSLANGMEEWSTFGTRGVTVVADPDKPGRKVLSLAKIKKQWPAVAVWNFPKANKGVLRTRVYRQEGAPMFSLELADHFSPPFDDQSQLFSLFDIAFDNNQAKSQASTIPLGKWVEVELRWDCDQRKCQVLVDGNDCGSTTQRQAGDGPSYVRFKMDDDSVGTILVDTVQVNVNDRVNSVTKPNEPSSK